MIPFMINNCLNRRIIVHDQRPCFHGNLKQQGQSATKFLHLGVAQASWVLSFGECPGEMSTCSQNKDVQQLSPIMLQEPTNFSCSSSLKYGSRCPNNDLMAKGYSPRNSGSMNHPRQKSMDLSLACSSRNVFAYGLQNIESIASPMCPSSPYSTFVYKDIQQHTASTYHLEREREIERDREREREESLWCISVCMVYVPCNSCCTDELPQHELGGCCGQQGMAR